MTYTPGDFYRICDRCGRKKLASETRKEWTGFIVCKDHWEARHPQDFVRGRRDEQRVPDPRPRTIDSLVGPLDTVTTAAAIAGASTIVVEATTRMSAGDQLRIALVSGTFYRAIILSVTDTTTLLLTAPLPEAVNSGALVVDTSAIPERDIG